MSQTTNVKTAAAPSINLSQIDAGKLGDVNNSVNLYRGDVNLPLSLASLPGRDNMKVEVSAFYGSNVHDVVNENNMDEPTDLLGVGWTLQTSKIVVDLKQTSSHSDGVFYLQMQGENHRLKRISASGDVITYQTKAFKFWTISYYKSEEKWEVINEHGIVYTFGGDLIKANDNSIISSEYNRCAFAVAWDNWMGDSAEASGSKMIVKGWYLGVVENLWEEQINYSYEASNFSIGGNSAAQYTRSTRISVITDINGRNIKLNYSGKNGYENQYPVIPPSNADNAIQFEFESKYLSSLEVRDENQLVLSTVQLEYELYNISDNSSSYYQKRYLTGLTQLNQDSQEQVPLNFEYYTSANDKNPGALSKIYYSNGSIATYTYDQEDVDGIYNNFTINAPSGYSKPKVWFGIDYVVITWWKSSKIKVQVYSWIGEWMDYSYDYNITSSSDSILVKTGEDLFALSAEDSSGRHELLLFHENIYQEGNWIPFEAETESNNDDLQFAIGGDFVTYCEYGNNNDEIKLSAYYWNSLSKSWELTSFEMNGDQTTEAKHFALAAQNNYIFLLYQNSSALKYVMYYQDEADVWQSPTDNNYRSISNTDDGIDWDITDAKRMLVTGSTFVAITYATGNSDNKINQEVILGNWDSNYDLQVSRSAKNDLSVPESMGFQSPVVDGSLATVAHKLFRFDGQTWHYKSVNKPDNNGTFFFGYGSDNAVICKPNGNNYDYKSYEFSPYTLNWSDNTLDSVSFSDAGVPQILLNQRIVSKYIYNKNSQYVWEKQSKVLSSDMRLNTMANRAPTYFAGMDENNDAKIFFIDNEYRKDSIGSNTSILAEDSSLTGINTLIAYKNDEDFNNPSKLYLYRITDKKRIVNHPKSYSVKQLSINTGFKEINTYYVYDKDHAVCDPFGRVVQYSQVKVYKGNPNGSFGYSLYQYYSGQNEEDTDIPYTSQNNKDYYSLLKGNVWRKTEYNDENEIVNQLTNTWDVIPNADEIYGAYVRLQQKEERIGGITKQVIYGYNSKGQQYSEKTFNYDSVGDHIQIEKLTYYGWEADYPEMETINLLTAATQVSTIVTNLTKLTPPINTGVSATTWRNDWNGNDNPKQWAAAKSYASTNEFSGSFNFNSYSGSSEPSTSNWLKVFEIKSRNATGQVVETIDTDITYSYSVYDKSNKFPISQFVNADKTEATYFGFEDYEDASRYLLEGDYAYNTQDVYTGNKSVQINGGDLKIVLRPTQPNQTFMMGCWIKTPTDFVEDVSKSSFNIDGASILKFPIKATNGEWQFQTVAIDFSNENASPNSTIYLYIINYNNAAVHVDNVFVCPMVGDFAATVFEAPFMLDTAVLGMRGELSRKVYNNNQQAIVGTNVDGQVGSLITNYKWRKRHSKDNTSHGTPNFQAAIDISSSSQLCLFKDDSWSAIWEPSDSAWQRNGQTLVCNTNDNTIHTLTLSNITSRNNVIRFQVNANDFESTAFSINFSNYSISWDTSGNWKLSLNGQTLDSDQISNTFGDCILVIKTSSIQFFVDGILALQYGDSSGILSSSDSNIIIETQGKIGFDYILHASQSSLALSYLDNIGNTLQDHLLNDKDCIVKGIVYDVIGQPIIKTKPIQYDGQTLSYKSNLVTNVNNSTGVMSGDVSNYYTEDNGYPYSSKIFERSTLKRLEETGAPGVDFAINPSTSKSNRHTVKLEYKNNPTINCLPNLRSGNYFYNLITNQDGEQTAQIIDQLGNTIVEVKGLQGENFNSNTIAITQNIYDNYGNLVKVLPPNAYANGNIPNADTTIWATTMAYDYFGRLISKIDPDTNVTSQFAYDNANRLRFRKDGNGIIFYNNYDSLGRILEEGITREDWNTLASNASNPNFQLDENTKSETRNYVYGLLSNDTTAIFQLNRLERINYSNTSNYIDYKYGINGEVLEIEDRSVSSYFRYAYNTKGKVISIVDVHDPDAYTVVYNYNSIHQMETIQVVSLGKLSTIDYVYNAGGGIDQIIYNKNTATELIEDLSYNSAGWIKSIEYENIFSETLEYTQNGYNDKGFYSGKIANINSQFNADYGTDFEADYDYKFDYDNRGQLSVAQISGVNNPNAYNIGTPLTTAYDGNGNVNNWQYNGEGKYNYYDDDTNKLTSTVNPQNEDYKYDDAGNTYETPDLSQVSWNYNYQQPSQHTERDNNSITSFNYNHFGQRIRKRGINTYVNYGYGVNKMVLKRSTYENSKRNDVKYYVYGPKGRLVICHTEKEAAVNDNPFNFLLKDHEGSVRAVYSVKECAIVSAYNYMPFGLAVGTVFESESICDYRYTGQEYDRETSLYNYRNRIYDPVIARFYSMDPQNQFASPYLYAGNDPILYTDFTGEFSWQAAVGLVLGVGEVALGIGVIIGTGLTGVGEVAGAVIGGALIGAGVSAISYSVSHGDDFNAAHYFAESLFGGVVGAASAGFGAFLDVAMEGVAIGARVGVDMVASSIESLVQNSANTLIEGGSLSEVFSAGNMASIAFSAVFSGGVSYGSQRITKSLNGMHQNEILNSASAASTNVSSYGTFQIEATIASPSLGSQLRLTLLGPNSQFFKEGNLKKLTLINGAGQAIVSNVASRIFDRLI